MMLPPPSFTVNLLCACARVSVRDAVVTKPPYEITETGWGEFEIIIKIFFIDPNERPVSNTHPLLCTLLYLI